MAEVKIGIVGGSGLYKMEALKDVEEVQISTRLVRLLML